jgi:hypothetical protein
MAGDRLLAADVMPQGHGRNAEETGDALFIGGKRHPAAAREALFDEDDKACGRHRTAFARAM